jgi:sugar/nucleoside kinase (ribokinase family)
MPARCYVLVTPDGERTMNTYLGAAQNLSPADIDADAVAASAILYLEGYLWDPKDAKDAFVKAAQIAHEAERKVALSLSDAFCVDRWRAEFLHLMRSHTVDLIFANEAEVRSLYQTADFDTAIKALRADVTAAVVTRSEQGCVVISPDGTASVRCGISVRPCPRCRRPHLRPPRRHGGCRSHPAHRRPPAGLAQRPCPRERSGRRLIGPSKLAG